MTAAGQAEHSRSLRMITSAMALVGILAACQLAETPPGLTIFGIIGTTAGSYVSYRRRAANNFWIKWALAGGILIVLGLFVEEIFYRIQSSIADARAPLTNMLIALQALHSFDLPKRRDLNVSALVGLVLVASAATLSRDLTFAPYLLAFIAFGSYMLCLDCLSRSQEGTGSAEAEALSSEPARAPAPLSLARVAPVVAIALPLCALATFLVMPRLEVGLLRNVRVSFNLHLPFIHSSGITNPMLSRSRRGDGSLAVNPLAYFGFNEELDLNYRGELSDQIVLRVSSPQGQFWRAMAFDIYDGNRWLMSRPDATVDRLTVYGTAIPLEPVPSLTIPDRVPVVDLNQVFHMEVDQPNLIPAASVPYLIYFPTNRVQIDSYGTLRSPVIMEKDMVYTVFSRIPMHDLAVLRRAPPVEPRTQARLKARMANYLQLPPDLPAAVSQVASEICHGAGNWFVEAERIDTYLKLNYKYNLEVPPTPAKEDTVADFLVKKRCGYCEHFASAFVVMCRTRGIPARLVTGFTPGDYNPFTGLWEVRMRDAHAWAEIFLPRWGWVTFDPTPDGVPPAFRGISGHSAFEFLGDRLAKVLEHLNQDKRLQAAGAFLAKLIAPLGHFVQWTAFFIIALWQPAAIALILLAAVVLSLKTVTKLRALGSRPASSPMASRFPQRSRATAYYYKLLKDLGTVSINRLPHETADELAARVRGGSGGDPELPDLVSQFLALYSESRFGTREQTAALGLLAAKIHKKVHACARAQRQSSRDFRKKRLKIGLIR